MKRKPNRGFYVHVAEGSSSYSARVAYGPYRLRWVAGMRAWFEERRYPYGETIISTEKSLQR